ncbi:MAG: hypothetical protein ACXWX1_11955 [Aeromicrobium sp.]
MRRRREKQASRDQCKCDNYSLHLMIPFFSPTNIAFSDISVMSKDSALSLPGRAKRFPPRQNGSLCIGGRPWIAWKTGDSANPVLASFLKRKGSLPTIKRRDPCAGMLKGEHSEAFSRMGEVPQTFSWRTRH